MKERFTPRERDEPREIDKEELEKFAEEFSLRLKEKRLHEDMDRRLERALSKLDETSEVSKDTKERLKIESDDESLAYLLGAMRDGSVYYDKASRNYFTMYYQKHREWLEDSISPRMEKLFDKEGKIEEYTEGHYRLKVSSKELYEMWKQDYDFPPDGEGQGSWNVPEDIKTASTHAIASYIRGVFDTEGDVSPVSSKSCYIGISQKNETFIEEVRGLLEDLDIHPGKTHVIDEKSGTLRIAVSEPRSLLRFITIIDSEHPDKHTNLRRVRSLLEQDT